MHSTSPPKAALYCRVSTPAQVRKGDPWASLERQAAVLHDLAATLGLEVGLVVQEQKSGRKGPRPEWERVLAAATAGEVQVVMAVAVDRLSRGGVAAAVALREQARAGGFRIHTLKGREMDLSDTAMAKFRNNLDASVNEYEADLIKERTGEGRQAKGKAGGYTGGPAPYGYQTRYDAEGVKRFEVDEEQAERVREMFQRCANGERTSDIARAMRQATGAHWYDATVKKMLENPTYIGRSNWQRTKGAHEPIPSTAFAPIVSLDLWETVENTRRIARLRSARGVVKRNPLAGILRCTTCGRGYAFTSHRPSYLGNYVCPYQLDGYANRCDGAPAFNAALSEAVVLEYLREHLPGYFLRQLDPEGLEAREKARKGGPKRDDAATLERQRQALEAKQAKVGGKLALEDDPAVVAGLRGALKEVAAELAAVELALAGAKQQAVKVANTRAVTRTMADKLHLLERVSLADRETLRLVFDAFLTGVTLEKLSEPRKRQVLRVATCELRDGERL